jgi:BCD family chlorophyll transporter-like MFS transporter
MLAYGLVFAVQAIGMILAIVLLQRVNVREFQDNARVAIASVMSNEIE